VPSRAIDRTGYLEDQPHYSVLALGRVGWMGCKVGRCQVTLTLPPAEQGAELVPRLLHGLGFLPWATRRWRNSPLGAAPVLGGSWPLSTSGDHRVRGRRRRDGNAQG
jgi:hypothetical protein